MAFVRHQFVLLPNLLAVALWTAVPSVAVAQQAPAPASKVAKAKPDSAGSGAPSKRDATTAQSDIDNASKLLAAGKIDPAIATLSTIISGGNLPSTIMARALYLRGTAYRQQSKPALAISDLTGALWLKGGLSETDRADATQQRAAAYSEAGLTDQGQAIAAGGSNRKRTTATEAPAPAASSGGLFAGLFGGGTTTASPPKDAAAPGAQAKVAKAAPPQPATPQASSQFVTTTVAPRAPSIAVAHAPAAIAAAPAKTVAASGHFQSRVALVRTRAEAEVIVTKLKTQYAAALADRAPDIGQAAFGNMGTFFQVGIGPFASASEAQALCGKLKGSGLDCVPISH